MPFKPGQRVRVLIPTLGAGDDDEEHAYPTGILGRVEMVEDNGRTHVEIGDGTAVITQVFDGEELHHLERVPDPRLTATIPPPSAEFGADALLIDDRGELVAHLTLRCLNGGAVEQQALRDRVVAAINAGQAESQIQHVKWGTVYDVLPEALFQVSTPNLIGKKSRTISDGDPVTVYRNPEGRHFVRFPDEMVSPRFEEVRS